jgi:YVTN family beta-propeller protein
VSSVIQLRNPSNPSFLAVTPDDARVYVSNGPSSFTINEFDVIDTATDTLTATIPNTGNCSLGIAMAPLIPQTKEECMDEGYLRFKSLVFRNQGQCVKYVNKHAK